MTAINSVTDLTIEDGIAVVTLDSPPVNALSVAVRDGIYQGVAQALDNDAVQAVVLICQARPLSPAPTLPSSTSRAAA